MRPSLLFGGGPVELRVKLGLKGRRVVSQGVSMFSDVGLRGSVVHHERGDDARFLDTAWTISTLRGGILWIIFNAIFGGFGILSSVPALGIGYAAGELISKSVNAKRSKGLAYVAAGAVVGAFIISLPSSPPMGFFGLIILFMAIYTAVQRVK